MILVQTTQFYFGEPRKPVVQIVPDHVRTESAGGRLYKVINFEVGTSADEIRIVTCAPLRRPKAQALAELFASWDSQPDTQTEEDWELLKATLDANRTSRRKLFSDANHSA